MQKTALVVGATGLIGSHIVEALLADSHWESVHVLGRRTVGFSHPKLVEHVVDIDTLSDNFPDTKYDAVFCCLGTTIKKAGSQTAFKKIDVDLPLQIAQKSHAGGADHFLLVTSIGADETSSVFYSRMKGLVERLIDEINFNRFSIFRPSMLAGDRKESRPAEKITLKVADVLSFVFKGFLKPYKPIQAKTVAKSMIIVAKQNNSGKTIYESDQIQALYDDYV